MINSKIYFIGQKKSYLKLEKRLINNHDIIFIDFSSLPNNSEKYLMDLLSKDYYLFLLDKHEELNNMCLINSKWFDASDFLETDFYNPIQNSYKGKFNTVLMGMSHSQCGVDENVLGEGNVLKMSSPSIDIYLQYHILKKAVNNGEFNNEDIRAIIIEMPYYYFNYDLSKFKDFLNTKLCYYKLINDFSKIGYNSKKIASYCAFSDLFRYDDIPKSNNNYKDNRLMIKKIYSSIIKPIANKDLIWSKEYKSTIEENTKLFDEYITYIKSNFLNTEIVLLIMPMNPFFYKSHKDLVNEARKVFYNVIKRYDFKIIDDFFLYDNPFLFLDHCHLSSEGAYRYSLHLKNRLEELL